MRCIAETTGSTAAHVERFERLTNLFLDGVTKDDDDAELFSHLSRCASCRLRLNALVEFSRLVREERFEVPVWTDSELFGRVEMRSARNDLTVRNAWAHKPAAPVRSRKTAGSLAAALALLLVAVALLPNKSPRAGAVTAHQEAVSFEAFQPSADPVYVFYPGLLIEESR